MKTLSEFLTSYLKEHLFNSTSLNKPETFDEMLERILCEGIYKYRKYLVEENSTRKFQNQIPNSITNALIYIQDRSADIISKLVK